MNRNALAQLRLDRRLIRRRGWIDSEELERELAALPDAAAKVSTQPAGERPAAPPPAPSSEGPERPAGF